MCSSESVYVSAAALHNSLSITAWGWAAIAGAEVATVNRQYPAEPLQWLPETLRLPWAEGMRLLQEAGFEVCPTWHHCWAGRWHLHACWAGYSSACGKTYRKLWLHTRMGCPRRPVWQGVHARAWLPLAGAITSMCFSLCELLHPRHSAETRCH